MIMKKGSVKAAMKCTFQKSFVLFPNPASLQNQRDVSFCHRAARRGNHGAPNEGKLVGLPKSRCNKTACPTDGQAGRPAGWRPRGKRLGSGGCGLAAPSIDEGEPALVRRALLIMLQIIPRFGEKG